MALVGALAWPLVFANDFFNGDWLAQLWFMWQQALAIRTNHAPTLFLNYPYGVFYPHYAFYGGTLYVLSGGLALALGSNPIAAYVLTYLLCFAAAYGGWYWLGRLCGLGRWWAHVPGLVFITSSYYLTLIYARGDWPELVGISAIPVVMAAGLSVLRAERLRLWPGLALTISTALLVGSHSLTLVWGTTTVVIVGVAILVCIPRARRGVSRRGAIRVAGVVVPAMLLSAWFLLPAAAYESNTLIATEYPHWKLLLRATMYLVSARHLFTISRASASTPEAAFALSLPILVIGWAILALALLLRRGLSGTWIRIVLICAGLTTLLIVVMTHAGLILALPRVYATMQFSYRLESYVLLTLAGTVLAILVLATNTGPARRRPPAWTWLLLPLLAVSVVGAIQQTIAHSSAPGRYGSFHTLYDSEKPGSGEVLTDYVDAHIPLLTPPRGAPEVRFRAATVHDNRVSQFVSLPPGQLFKTNVQGPPALLHISGARIAGMTQEGYDVLEMSREPQTPSAGNGARAGQTVSLSPASPLPVLAGRVLTFLAIAALLVQFGALGLRRLGVRPRLRTRGRARS